MGRVRFGKVVPAQCRRRQRETVSSADSLTRLIEDSARQQYFALPLRNLQSCDDLLTVD